MMAQKSLLIAKLKNYAFSMEYLLLSYVLGLSIFVLEMIFCFESRLVNAGMCIVRLIPSFFIIFSLWSLVLVNPKSRIESTKPRS